MLVVLSHVVMVVSFLRPLEPFRLAMGCSGVAAFFVLSGFLLGRPYVTALVRGSALPQWRRFARRRFVRIWPAYAVVVLAATFKSLIHHGSNAAVYADIATHLAMIHNLFPGFVEGADNIALWTMAVDAQFYVALPVAAWLLYRFGRRIDARAVIFATLGAVVVASVAWRISIAAFFPHASELAVARSVVGMGTSFAIGVLLATLGIDAPQRSERTARVWCGAALAVSLAEFALSAAMPDSSAYKMFVLDLLAAIAIGTFVFAIPNVGWPSLDRALEAKCVTIFAANAYALYLVHVPIKQTVESVLASRRIATGTPHALLFTIAFVSACAATAPLLHHGIEKPFMRLTRPSRASRSTAAPEAAAAAAVA